MLELKFVVNNPDIVKADLKKRGMLDKIGWVDELITLDSEQKKLQKELDNKNGTLLKIKYIIGLFTL